MKRREEIQEKANELYYSHTPYEATVTMAEWADETMINKACEWIKQHLYDEAYLFRDNEGTWVDTDLVIDDLKKAMEE